MSNERRVARSRQEWLYEFENSEEQQSIDRFAIKKKTIRAIPGQLTAHTMQDLVRQLRSVAAFTNDKGIRLHIEWVWDGKKLWIVQGDKDQEERSYNPGAYLSSEKPLQSEISLKSFQPLTRISNNRWHKVNCQKDFKGAGLAGAPIWVLEDPSILSNLQNGFIEAALTKDIADLLSSPIVIRMDVTSSMDLTPDMPNEMLPRSDCLTKAEQV